METKIQEDTIAKTEDFSVKEITVSEGMTLNLGNYESFRLDTTVTLSSNIRPTSEQEANDLRTKMFREGWDIVEKELNTKVSKIRELSAKRGV